MYPWQLPALLLGWLALRHLAESIADRQPKRLAVHALAWGLCTLAVWMSSASAPMLLVLAAIEIWRSWMLRAPAPRPRWAELGEATVPVFVAAGLEEVLRWRYHVFAAEHYEQSFRTALHVDRGHLAVNALAVLHRASEFQWLIPCLVGLLGGGASALFLLRREQLSRESTSGRWNDRLLLEAAFLILACSALALIQLPVLIAVDHVRMNDHDMRYFTLVQFFASCAGLFIVAALVLCWMRSARARRVVRWSAASLTMVALFAALPAPRESAADSARRENAQEIAHRKPHIVLVSGYWDAYAMAALVPGEIVGLPVEGDWLRTPWDLAALRSSREVVVGHQGAFSVPNLPPGAPIVEQYGVRLRLLTADWYSKHGMRYSLYEHVGTEQPRSAETPR